MEFCKIMDEKVDISKKKEVFIFNLTIFNMIDGLVGLKCIKTDSDKSRRLQARNY
jgi:hypothetical protein